MSTSVDLDTSELTDLDFPVPCGHSQHWAKIGLNHDGGDAKFVAVAYHNCREDESAPTFYPCCESWAKHVMARTAEGASMMCTRCGEVDLLSEMVAIVSAL